ncbi:MAG: AAA family ATPase [Bacteroidales bacterium]|jgi:predicted kinase|nr:AAA family ATPase [Bacteroidales bacterium]
MIWKFPYYDINTLVDWDKIEEEFDWFVEMKDVPQDKTWHAEGNVQIHTRMVIESMLNMPEFKELNEQDKHILFTAALMHDIEKRSTTTTEVQDGVERIVSPFHAKRGEKSARTILYKDIVTPFDIREQIARLIRLHGLPIWAVVKSRPDKRVIEASLMVNTRLLYILAKADVLGRIGDNIDDTLLKIELFKELCIDNNCFGKPRHFADGLSRYTYLNKKDSSPDYVAYDNCKFNVYVMSALPGSGKDSYIKQNLNYPVLSLDDIRRENRIDPTDKKGNGRVIQMAMEQARRYMRRSESFVFNATNITSDMRRKWISLFMEYGARVTIIYIEVSYKKLLKQNSNREYVVPEDVINKNIAKLDIPTYGEAHDIFYVCE